MLKPNGNRTPSYTRMRPRGVGRLRPAPIFVLLPSLLFLLGLALILQPGHPALAQTPSPTFSVEAVTPPTAPPAAALGGASYAANCAACHGETGAGDGPTAASLPSPPTAFADPASVWSLSPAELFHTTKFGRIEQLMPPWQNRLSDEEIWQTVMYAWSLHTNETEVAGGQTLYAQNCVACHGETGAGDGPEAQGDLPDFSDVDYAMVRSQEAWLQGWQEAHPEIGQAWTPEEQRQVLEYIRTFSYIPAWESGYRPGPGVIRGTVTQGTAGETLPSGLVVSLDVYAHFSLAETFTTTVDADGAFEFTNLSVAENFSYLASVEIDGVYYSSPLVLLNSEVSEAETSIIVYATTTEPTDIHIDRVDWVIDNQPGALLMLQIYYVGSGGDRTFIGAPVEGQDIAATVGIHLPEGAEQVIFEGGVVGERFHQVGDIYYDTTPLVPGQGTKQVIVRYLLPYDGTNLQYDQRFLYSVAQTNLLLAELPQLEATISPASGPAWTTGETQDIQGRAYRLYQAGEMPASAVTLDFRGLLDINAVDPREAGNASTAVVRTATFAPWMAWSIGALSLLVIAGGVFWSWRSGRVELSERPEDIRQEMDKLSRHIAQLDDRHALGQLDSETWQQQRSQLKARLWELARSLEERQ